MSSSNLSLVPTPPGEPRSPIPAPLEKRLQALDRAAERLRHPDADPEAIHDARVATRRLTAILDVGRAELAPGQRRRVRRQLARARRRLGPYREREVSLGLLEKEMAAAPAATAEALRKIVSRLVAHGEGDRTRAASVVSPARVEKIADRLRRAVLRGTLVAWDTPEAMAPASARVERRRAQAIEALDRALAAPSDTAFHAARVAAKKWRYGMEIVAELREGEADPALSALRDLQERLGAMQDRAVLARLLEREARRASKRADVASLYALLERAGSLRAENLRAREPLASSLERLRAPSA